MHFASKDASMVVSFSEYVPLDHKLLAVIGRHQVDDEFDPLGFLAVEPDGQ
jgi:hypothetical protein